MNNFAYLTTSLAIKRLSQLSKLKINIHGKKNIPVGSIIFVANHFTRIETLFLPHHLHQLTVPALVIQADGDPIVDPKGSRKVFELISSIDKEYRLFNFNRHGILLGKGAERVHRAIGDFALALSVVRPRQLCLRPFDVVKLFRDW